MKNKTKIAVVLGSLLCYFALAGSAIAAYDLTWSVIGSGGGPSGSSSYAMQSTVGQPVIGPAKLNYELGSGFWYYWYATGQLPRLNVTITETPDPVGSGNTSTVKVTVTSGGAAVSGAGVTVSTTGGSLSPTSGTTDTSGNFLSTYTAPIVNATTNCTISATASKTGYTSGSGSDIITVCYAPWDVNQDGKVNVQDLVIVGQHFGQTTTPPYPRWDVNGDGKVNVQDLVIVGQHFGQLTCYP